MVLVASSLFYNIKLKHLNNSTYNMCTHKQKSYCRRKYVYFYFEEARDLKNKTEVIDCDSIVVSVQYNKLILFCGYLIQFGELFSQSNNTVLIHYLEAFRKPSLHFQNNLCL